MKRTNKLFTCLLLVVLILVLALGIVGCKKNNDDEGGGNRQDVWTDQGEQATYYCTVDGSEYFIELKAGNYRLSIAGITEGGTYTYNKDTKELSLVATSGSKRGAELDLGSKTIRIVYSGSAYEMVEKIEWTVSFNVGGGSPVGDVKVYNGGTISRPADPELANNIFVWWYKDAEMTQKFNFGVDVITSNTTLYAKYVEKTDGANEFNVTLINKGKVYDTVLTNNGVLYNLPELGEGFMGWWMSDSDDSAKLSRKYVDTIEIKSDCKFYAVWESDESIAVSAYDGRVEWAAVENAGTYSFSIVRADDEDANNIFDGSTQTTATSFNFDFSGWDAGEYIITVSTANNVVGRAYVNNKALARVCRFNLVDEFILGFNKVENATEYYVSYACGTSTHVHKNIKLTDNFTLDFEGCIMPADGIRFVITAVAEGYMSSVSEEYVLFRALDNVNNLVHDTANEVVKWDAVAGAVGYDVTITVDGEKVDPTEVEGNVNGTSVDVSAYRGNVKVTVTPRATGYMGYTAEVSFMDNRLTTPTNIKVNMNTISWDAVKNAKEYTIRLRYFVGGVETVQELVSNGNKNSINMEDYFVEGVKEYVISVSATADNAANNSAFSGEFTARVGEMSGELTYNNGILSWNAVLGVSGYRIIINEGVEVDVYDDNGNKTGTASVESVIDVTDGSIARAIKLTKAGENTIKVVCLNSEGEVIGTDSVTKVITAYEIRFYVGKGKEPIDSLYLAIGDAYTLPDGVSRGFVFYGWFADKDAQGEAVTTTGTMTKEFADAMTDNRIVYYAGWTDIEWTISFNVGNYGTMEEDVTVKAVYQADYGTEIDGEYYLPVPEATDVNRAFAGWYRERNGAGRKYADYTGKINGSYPLASDCVLYAYWVEVFSYKATYNAATSEYDTVTVSKGPALTEGMLAEVTIPSRYYGTLTFINEHLGTEEGDGESRQQEATKWWTVTRIADDAFQSCSSLVRVNIPNTITTAGVGSEGSYYSGAFKYCSKLTTLFVYDSRIYDADATKGQLVEVNYAPDEIYWSLDGVLYKNDSASNEIEVTCYPYAKTDSIAYIAYPVTLIPQYTFYGAKFTTVYLPASVKRVGNGAFRSCTNLTTVIFNEAEEGQTAANGLELASGTTSNAAFYSNSKLTYVNFPARLSKFDANVFASCSAVSTLLVGNDKINGNYYSHIASYDANGAVVGSIVTDRTRRTLIYMPRGYKGVTEEDGTTSYTIPSNISVIGEWSFGGSSSTYACKFNKIVIPGTVSKIEEGAFAYCQSMTQLIFEGKAEDVDLEICEFAFYYCNKLVEVTLPANLKILRQAAFAYTTLLKTVNVTTDRAMVEYEAGAFATKTNTGNGIGTFYVNTVNLSKTVPDFAVSSVFGTSTLKAVNVEDGNPYYQSIEGILYNGNVTRLLFYPADKVGEYIVPETIKEIEPSTFANKTNLTGVVLHAGIEKIGGDAFKSCSGLLRVEFKTPQVGEAVVDLVIGDGAFYSCTYLTEITVPYRTTRLGDDAFRSCSRLNTINFEETPSVQTERDLVLGEYVFSSVGATATDGKRFTAITLPDRTVEIGNCCFYLCSYLARVNIPASVTKMGYYETRTVTVVSKVGDSYVESAETVDMEVCLSMSAFYQCYRLEEIAVDPANPIYTSIDGVLYSREYYPVEATNYTPYTYPTTATGTIKVNYTEFESKFYDRTDGTVKVLIACPTSNSGVDGTVVIPNTVMATWYGAFYYNGNPTYVEEGVGIKTVRFSSNEVKNARGNELLIGKNTFYYSKKLETVELPKGVGKIPQYTFYQCSALRNINIPNTVSRIEPQAFYYCTALDNIVFEESDPENVITLDLRNDLNNASTGSTGGIFYNCNALTTLTLPERTIELGRYSLSGTKLETVNLPSTLQRIDYNAFRNVTTLKTVIFPAEMAEGVSLVIEDYVFADCSALTTIDLPEGLEGIGYYAFYNCTALKEITLPSTLNEFGKYYYSATSTSYGYVFYNCKALEKAEFAYTVVDGVKVTNAVLPKIGGSTFRNCASLTEFYVPASVETIDTYAFAGCSKLTSVTFEKGSIEGGSKLATIGNYAFQGTALTEFIFPESSADVMELGSNIFNNCSTLTKVYLSRNIADIGAAFKGCSNISDLTVSPKNVNFKPYESTDGKKYPLLVDPDGTAIKFVYGDIVGEFAIPEGIESIADDAFKDQAFITKITLPASLISIGQYAFSYCSSLEEVVMPYDSAIETIGQYSFEYTSSLKHIDIPGDENGVMKVRLEGNCFQYSGIESITFRGDIAFVGNYVFRNCTNLTKVNNWVPNMPFIPNYFFYGCSSLENFTIPRLTDSEGNVKPIAIKTYALYGTAIKNLVVPGYVTEIGNYAFANNVNMETVTFEDNTALVEGGFGTYVFRGCTALKTVDLSPLKELNWINTYTFYGCTALEEVTLPEKLANLNNTAPSKETATTAAGSVYTFYGCTSLKTINNLDDNITIIGGYAFYNCSSLEEIVLPSELRIIGSYCFSGCTSLTNVDFDHIVNGAIDPEGQPDENGNPARIAGTGRKLENIMTYAFGASSATIGTPAIEKIVIPSTVKALGAGAFRYNESVKEVEFEYNTALTVFGGSYVFANCINLEKVNLNNLPNLEFLGSYVFNYCSSLKTIAVDSDGNATNRFPDKLIAIGTSKGTASATSFTYAFRGCSNLEFIDLNKVTMIGGYTFIDCTSLKSVKGIEEVTILGSYTFRNTALEEVTFGKKVTAYGYGVFADCIGLKKATVEKSGLTYVGYNNTSTTLTSFTTSSTIYGPFGGCISLEEVTLPDNLTNIVPHTFANCTGLKSINFAALSKVVNICSYAFYNTSLEEADLSALSSLTVIGSYAFAQTETLKKVTFPTKSTLTTIGIEAFSGDSKITSISIPASVTTINKKAFCNCGLTEFTVPAGLTTIGESVFAGNNIVTYKSNNSNYRVGGNGELIQIVADGDDLVVGIPATFNGVYVFEKGTAPGPYCFAGVTGLTGVQFPEGITELPSYSFAGYAGKVTLPETITSIGSYAFYESELTDFVIPASVTSVGYRAFGYATIDKLVIPSTVEKVGQYLCYYANIREFEYNVLAATWINSSGNELSTNGAAGDSSMLSYVSGLEKITVGEGVQYVGTYFIWGATNCDATVYFPDGMDMTSPRLIYSAKGCKFDVRLPSDMKEFGMYAFYNGASTEPAEGWNEFKMTIPDSVETLPKYFFGGCIINDVVFPKNIKTINPYALCYCTRETEFVIPKTLETYEGHGIRYGTFSHVVFEEGLEEIPASASGGKFYYTTIGEMTLPSTLNTIGGYFLYYAKGPAKLVLPEGLKNVGAYAFYYNKNIYELYLPTTVEFVDGNTAFSGWTEEQTIYSTLDRTATMAVWGASINATTFKGNVVYDYVPTPEQTENSVEIAIEGEVAFVDNKQD